MVQIFRIAKELLVKQLRLVLCSNNDIQTPGRHQQKDYNVIIGVNYMHLKHGMQKQQIQLKLSQHEVQQNQ